MVEKILEFITNHPILVGIFVFLVIAFLVNEGKQGGASVSTADLVTMVNREDAFILDVRESKEFSNGHISGAVNIPLNEIDNQTAELEKRKGKPVVVVCKMGQHSGAAGKKLKKLGFENVRRLSGGMAEWSANGLPLVKA